MEKVNITPIHKKGSKQKGENYRPIGLASVVWKILESLVWDAVIEYVEVNNLLTTCQHGFTTGKFYTTQLLIDANGWTELLD